MTQGRVQRYDRQFLRDFRGPITVNAAVVEEQVVVVEAPPPPPVFNEGELEQARIAAKKLGYAEGFEAGLAQANTEAVARQKDIAHAVDQMKDQLKRLASQYQQLINQQSAELSELVIMIARKVAGEALAAHGTETLSGLMTRCLGAVFGKPRVMIELSPATLELAKPVLTEQLNRAGFEGEIQFRANEKLESHDMRIDWGHGEATRTNANLWQEIEALLQQVSLTPTLPQPVILPPEETTHG